MTLFWLIMIVALVFSSIGFKKYIWFISVGYGFSIAAIGAALLLMLRGDLPVLTICGCVLFIIYGCRLGIYLLIRESGDSSYNRKMEGEMKSGKDISMTAKCAIWVSASLLYACQTCPVVFRIADGKRPDTVFIIGLVISLVGLVVESAADFQKSLAKSRDPHRFVDTGLYRLVRCPNYFGEMLFWTGVFVGGITAYTGILQWFFAILGYVGIIYVMFGGARRLEIRQNRTYGDDPAYRKYVKTTPIMIPFVPLYSVEKYKWLIA